MDRFDEIHKRVSTLFENYGYLYEDDDRFGFTMSCPREGEFKWELIFMPIKKNPKEYTGLELLEFSSRTTIYSITLDDRKVVTQMNAIRPQFTHNEFLETLWITNEFLKFWIESQKNLPLEE